MSQDKVTLLVEPQQWTIILKIWDMIRQNYFQPNTALDSTNSDSEMYALQLLESMVKNCGSSVHEELMTQAFCESLSEIIRTTQHENVRQKTLELIQTWAYPFRNSPECNHLKKMINVLKSDGYKFPQMRESDAMFSAGSAPVWADGEVCHRCRAQFSIILRKRHCRACGQVFCGQCSSKTSTLPEFGIETEVRVCDACFEAVNKPSTTPVAVSKDDDLEEYLESSVEQECQSLHDEFRNLMNSDGYKFSQMHESVATFSADSTPVWADGEVCGRCRTQFSMILRKHHCRACGQVFCDQCSSKRTFFPKLEIVTGVRVCDACFEAVIKPSTNSDALPLHKSDSKIPEKVEFLLGTSQSEAEATEKEKIRVTSANGSFRAQVKDARAALNAMRTRHQEILRLEAEKAERILQMLTAHKLDIMRKTEQEYLQYQRQEQQKLLYIMAGLNLMGSPVHGPQFPPNSGFGYQFPNPQPMMGLPGQAPQTGPPGIGMPPNSMLNFQMPGMAHRNMQPPGQNVPPHPNMQQQGQNMPNPNMQQPGLSMHHPNMPPQNMGNQNIQPPPQSLPHNVPPQNMQGPQSMPPNQMMGNPNMMPPNQNMLPNQNGFPPNQMMPGQPMSPMSMQHSMQYQQPGAPPANPQIWDSDAELFDLMKKEKKRQKGSLEMTASENFTTLSVLQCLGSSLHNKHSEGLPGQRFCGGNEFIDQVEILAQKRALEAYNLDSENWGVNVQPYSGSPAKIAVYTAVAGPHGKIMELDLLDGGHFRHNFMTPTKKISTSMVFKSMAYKVDPVTGLIDYDQLEKSAKLFRPKVIVAGISCYTRALNYKKLRQICDEVGALLFSDMTHISGLVAAGIIPSPFDHSDIVSTTTHNSLRGPRAAVIFFRKGVRSNNAEGGGIMYDLESKINQAVFSGLQGSPHNNAIAGIATTMKQAKTSEFVQYQKQVVANARRLASGLQSKGYKLVTGGTDVHLLLVDLCDTGVSGAKAEHILEEINIACNKNTVPGDKSALNPSGFRLGTPAITTRGFVEKDIDRVADFIDRGIQIAKEVGTVSGPKLEDFKKVLEENTDFKEKVHSLKKEVIAFCESFPLPGHEEY